MNSTVKSEWRAECGEGRQLALRGNAGKASEKIKACRGPRRGEAHKAVKTGKGHSSREATPTAWAPGGLGGVNRENEEKSGARRLERRAAPGEKRDAWALPRSVDQGSQRQSRPEFSTLQFSVAQRPAAAATIQGAC